MNENQSITPKETQRILVAIGLSVATKTCPEVEVSDVEAACRFIRSRFDDVDWDWEDNAASIFGDDRRIPVCEDDEGNEAHFTIRLVGQRIVAVFRKPSGETVIDSSYHGSIDEAKEVAFEDANRYGWNLVSVATVNA
jgi:hypothetical protein